MTLPVPYYQDEAVTIYCGDALDILSSGVIPAVDVVIADPPYCSGGRQQVGARNVISKNRDEHRSDAEWLHADNMGSDSYVWWMRQIGRRLFDLATPGAHFYCFTDWRQYTNIVTACETVGWSLRSCVVWDKMRGGALGSFWRNDHEWVPVFAKGQPRALPHGGFFNVLHCTKGQGGDHPTEKPIPILQSLVEAGGGEVVLDPFMGSGTTLRAAKNLGRRAIGIEIDPRWCEIAVRRLSQAVLPLAMPA
jgi:DNA modification methylase